ncbi:MAG TPA: Co2+/Mg2+ efflux protein ApaG [Leucothrix mucor]|uniref:Protein ApaG n=1 Tax=Leucothrix mucor TaxID=45248 RepID=A0A7V2SYJ6_LEUMU|nr:Co2+/Mg2+ efflux protein ApaG [Leucothrix mucor]
MKNKKHYISISVETYYIEAESDAKADRFMFAYTITIKNKGAIATKLLTRHWIITDANNHVQEVKGKGVIGKQPHLKPDESFKYTSGTIIETPVGSMQGSFHMITDDGDPFEVEIAPFSLAIPRILN